MISVKIHKSYRNVVAVCDSDLIGKTFEEGIKQIKIRESFFRDKELSAEETIALMKTESKEDSTFNIVGKQSIKAAKQAGIITEEGIGYIQGIPYALVLL